jgi:signal transduction histidine kinase
LSTQNTSQIAEALSASARPVELLNRECFRTNELLEGISPDLYEQLAEKIDIVHFRPNEIIFEENDPGTYLYLIARGSVKISKKGRGGQQETLAYLMEGDFFGEMALADGSKRSAQASAVDDVVLGQVDQSDWDLLLRLAPHEVLNNFTKSITKRLRHNNQHFIEEMMRNERLSLIGTTISSVAHDMNNPISCIRCACEAIRTENQDALVTEATDLIRDAVGKMENMTRELIDFSRGHTQLNLQPVAIAELIRDLETDFAKCRPIVDVHVEIRYDGKINADRYRLVRVFSNVIRNAREAMAKTDDKKLLFAVNRIDSRVSFEISDTGCGIPVELLPRIFEPFVTHGKSSGTGLGLAISKAVVEAHHGSISVQTTDRGTSFRIDLPLQS